MFTEYKVQETLERLFNYYLLERHLEKTLSLVIDEVYSLGTGEHGIVTNKEAFRGLLIEELAASPEPITYEIHDYTEHEIALDVSQCSCKLIATAYDKRGASMTSHVLVTATFCRGEEGYKASSLHFSSSGETQDGGKLFPLKCDPIIHEKMQISSQKKIADLMFDMIPGGIMGSYLEDGFPLYVINEELLSYLGYTYEQLIEETEGMMVKAIHEEDIARVKEVIIEASSRSEGYEVEYRMKKRDGTFIWVLDRGKKIRTEDERMAMISIIVDISKSIQAKEQLQKEATLDPLLHIYNRKEAVRLIEFKRSKGIKGTLLVMDIDNFKKVNDYYGHQEGDKVLKKWARLLMQHVREKDIVARLGGDEFIVYLSEVTSQEIACKKAKQLCRVFAREIGEYPDAKPSVSIGGICDKEGRSFKVLYPLADQALYEMKAEGKGCVRII